MDTLAHGLWGGVAFGRKNRGRFIASFILGMSPDLLSFGFFFLTWAVRGFPPMSRLPGEPPDPSMIPAYVGHLYNITHSAVIWGLVFFVLTRTLGRPPWVFGAWLLHILCDIPTHTKEFFPTPYLWPFQTPFVDGFRWSAPWFLALNYTALIASFVAITWVNRRKHSSLDR